MKRNLLLLLTFFLSVGIYAKETVVWTGSEQISWNQDIPGTQFETPEGIFTGLAAGNTILVYTSVNEGYGDPNYVITYKAGDSWSWTDLGITVSNDGIISYTVESEQIATEIAERGLILRGQAYVASKISIVTDDEVVEDQCVQTVWEGSEPISWNTEAVPGTQFETPEGTFTGLAAGNIIKVYTVATEGDYGDPQYVVTYKAGDSWSWTDLIINVSDDGIISYTVESEQIATEIAERGLIFRGQAYTITKIVIQTVADAQVETIKETVESSTDVWTGSQAISWNGDIPGEQYEINTFTSLKQGDVINIYTSLTTGGDYGDPQYGVTYKAGDSWSWTDLTIDVSDDGTISYTVESDQIATEIAERGLILRGQAYTISRIEVVSTAETNINYLVLNAEEEELFSTASGINVKLCRPNTAGWTTLCLPFNTTPETLGATKVYAFSEQDGDVLKFSRVYSLTAGQPYLAYYAQATDEAILIKNVDITVTTRSSNDIFIGTFAPKTNMEGLYSVTTDGKIMQGSSTATLKGYRAYFVLPASSRYAISFDDETTGIGMVSEVNTSAKNAVYNLAGQRIAQPQRGIYIKNGKKYFVK